MKKLIYKLSVVALAIAIVSCSANKQITKQEEIKPVEKEPGTGRVKRKEKNGI